MSGGTRDRLVFDADGNPSFKPCTHFIVETQGYCGDKEWSEHVGPFTTLEDAQRYAALETRENVFGRPDVIGLEEPNDIPAWREAQKGPAA